ncbi:hypothetical protein VPH35_114515 [Triticum aestivum]
MLRLRGCVLTQLLSSPATSPVPHLRRLISAAAPAVSPNIGFAVEEYLVATCGLTRTQAVKASPKLSHLKSPAKPDAVLAFLAGLGLSAADVASVVAKDPLLLCAKVEKTLAPVVDGLTGLGLSRPEIAHLVSVAGEKFRCRAIIYRLHYYLALFGSSGKLLRVLDRSPYILSSNLERVVKPNAAFLRECRIGACDIAKLCVAQPRMLTSNVERVRAMAARAEGLGVPRGSRMFWRMLNALAFLREKDITAKVEYLKDTFRWSDAEVGIALCKAPMVLALSKDLLQRKSEFLISESCCQRRYSWRSSYAPTRKLHHNSLKTMQQRAKGKCRLDSDLHEARPV